MPARTAGNAAGAGRAGRMRRANGTGRGASGSLFRSRPAFTLIELMAVLAVIAILAGIVIGGVQVAQTKATRNRALADLERLATAIENYRGAKGFYPSSERPGSGPGRRFGDALVFRLLYEPVSTGSAPCIELRSGDFDADVAAFADAGQAAALLEARRFVDPWGKPWRYRRWGQLGPPEGTSAWHPGDSGSKAHNADTYDLSSVGPDGVCGTADALTTWAGRP